MSIKKITQTELLEKGVSALPTRPSAPSLYSGQTLSAKELREAFDRLPTLLAERFNALLDALGLFDENTESDTLSALVATNIAPGHSLADLFADIQSGNVASYLSVDGSRSLFEILSALEDGLEQMQTPTVRCVGDGDIVSDITVRSGETTLYKTVSQDGILSTARKYSDSPRGSIQEEEARPVSGSKIAAALNTKADSAALVPLGKRIKALESFTQGTLYSYEYIDTFGASSNVPENALGQARLICFGGITLPAKNCFPEKLLPKHHFAEPLSIDWDEENGTLVLNGTLPQGTHNLMHFIFPIEKSDIHAALFYCGGTAISASGVFPTLYFHKESGETVAELPLAQENSLVSASFAVSDEYIEYLTIVAAEETVFTDYRFNLLLTEGEAPNAYTPANYCEEPAKPCALRIESRNLWTAETALSGTTFVEFVAQEPYAAGMYTLSFELKNYGTSRIMLAEFLLTDGTVFQKTLRSMARNELIFTTQAPFYGFRIYAQGTPERSEGIEVAVLNVMLESGNESFGKYVPYKTPSRIAFPSAFWDFPTYGLGLKADYFSCVDLETREYEPRINAFIFDGSEDWQEDNDFPGCFSCPVEVPEDISDTIFRSTGLFFPRGENEYASFWFGDGKIIVNGTYEQALTSDKLRAMIAEYPFRILYAPNTVPFTTLPSSAAVLDNEIYFTVDEGDVVFAETESGDPRGSYFCILYQIKNTEV